MTEQPMFDADLRAALSADSHMAQASVVDAAILEAAGRRQRTPRVARLDTRAWPPRRMSLANPAAGVAGRSVVIIVLLALALSAAAAVGSRLLQRPLPPEPFSGTSLVSAGTLPSRVDLPTALALADGRMLVIGGAGPGAFGTLFDPATGTGDILLAPLPGIIVLDALAVPDGRVFVLVWEGPEPPAAGRSLAWTYDPLTNRLSAAIETLHPRFAPSVALLSDGRVLLSGGTVNGESTAVLTTTELFDPASSTFAEGPDLPAARLGHLATGLPGGEVLLVGGPFQDTGEDLLAVQVFDPGTGDVRPVGLLNEARVHIGNRGQRLVPLPSGQVLIIGRQLGPQLCGRHNIDPVAAYRYDPATGVLERIGDLPHAVRTAAALPDGRVVVAGEWQALPDSCASVDYVTNHWLGVYDPDTGVTAESRDPLTLQRSLPVDPQRPYGASVLLPNGRVALVGEDPDGRPNSIDVLEVAP